MTEEETKEAIRRMRERANALIAKGRLPVKEAKDLRTQLDENSKSDEMKLEKVKVGVLPDYFSTIETPGIVHLVWAWMVGYAAQEVRNSTTGEVVSSPLAVFSWAQSLLQNWWKYLLLIIILYVVVSLIK